METYNKIRKLFDMEVLIRKRQKQLQEENLIDDKLKNCYYKCPYQVTRYLFNMRRLNRIQSIRAYDQPIFNIPDETERIYETVEVIQKSFWSKENIKNCNEICSLLPDINKKIEINFKN